VGGRNREQFEGGSDLRAQADVDTWPEILVMMTILGRKSWLLLTSAVAEQYFIKINFPTFIDTAQKM